MKELFARTETWDNVATKNWSVSGGETLGLGAVLGGEAKVLVFTHNELGKKKAFIMMSGSLGAKLEMEIPAAGLLGMMKGGWVDSLLGWGGAVKPVSDASGMNPLDFSPPTKIQVENAFSVSELVHAIGCAGSVGATGGVVDTGVLMASFWKADNGRHLFSMDDVTIQATLGAGINMGTIQGSVLLDVNHPPNEKYFRQTGAKKGQWYHSGGKI